MRGHIRKREWKRKDGSTSKLYYAVVFIGVDPRTDKKHYDWGRGYRTKREAEGALTKKLSALADGTFVRSASLTFGDYLTDWLPSVEARIKPTTFATYKSTVERFLIPMLGTRRLQDLTTLDLTAFYSRIAKGELPPQAKHPRRANKPLSAKSVENIARVVSKALNDALDHGLVSRNVALRAKRPRPQKPEVQAWTAPELRAFLDLTRDQDLGTLWALLAATGLRRGEALGLRWEDVSFGSKRISVRQTLVSHGGKIATSTPKNHQARTVDLDEATAAMLRRHRSAQKQERLAFGPGYNEATDLVFRKEDGSPYHPDVVSTFVQAGTCQGG